MAGKWYWVACATFVAAIIASAAFADEPAEAYLEEYKAYNTALEAGDSAAAVKHGYAAWQAAEAELGDHQLTAVLAYNYGQLVLFSDPPAAMNALRRAMSLQNAGIAELPPNELNLYLSFAEFANNSSGRKNRDALRAALSALEEDAAEPSPDIAAMWLELALADLNNKNEAGAIESALKAEAAYKAAAPQNYRKQAESVIAQGASHLLKRNRAADNILAANREFVRASKFFPIQKSLESFDPVLSTAMAWNSAAYAMLTTMDQFKDTDPETYLGSRIRLSRPDDIKDVDPSKFIDFDYTQVFEENPGIDDCQVDWAIRKPVKYPREAANRGYVGAALIGYRLAGDLKAHDAFILSEVPGAYFGKVALESVSDWRLSAPPVDHPWCRENVLTVFYFVFSSD